MLTRCPVVNNVGTLASVLYIMLGGAAWYTGLGSEGSPGTAREKSRPVRRHLLEHRDL